MHLNTVRTAFTKQGHPTREVDHILKWASQIPRENLLQYREKQLLTTYPELSPTTLHGNPHGVSNSLQPMLDGDPILKEIFLEALLLAFKQPSNISKLIIRTSSQTRIHQLKAAPDPARTTDAKPEDISPLRL
ncbi:hypothetical protein UY3_12520 [Chelonia mydas]|uniref:Uncharacterized protein n=1 Tax=Chelonia mydas TaxID=8469 RepID=M7B032_CHEMY|nr:hypothetical protein UY3_12520 [Chelonia mydas]